MAEKQDKKSKKDKKENDIIVKNTIELNPKLEEETGSTAVFTFGRMNPPTIGHEKLVRKIEEVAKRTSAMPHIYLSQSYDSKKNPLPYNKKISLARRAFGNSVTKSAAKTLIQVVQELQKMGHKKLIMVAGADRVNDFKTLLNKYNGKDYEFDSIEVVSAGERDPDAEGAEGMSASKMRAAVAAGDEKAFALGLPSKLKRSAKSVFNAVRDGMKIAEEMEKELGDEMLIEAPLTLAQRRRRGMATRRAKQKILRGRRIAQRKMASKDKLKIRARRKAIQLIRRRIAGAKGKDYASLSPSEKIQIDKRVQQRKAAIGKIATRLMPKVTKAERERLKRFMASKNEEHFDDALNIIMEAYFKVDIEGLPAVFMTGPSEGTIKQELRRIIKNPNDNVNSIERVQRTEIIKAFRLQAQGKSIDDEPVGVDEAFESFLDEGLKNPKEPKTQYKKFHELLDKEGKVKHDRRFRFNKKVEVTEKEDKDIGDKEGSQPAKYHSGLDKSTKEKRDRQFKNAAEKDSGDPSAYPEKHAGDEDAKTKTSKHTLKYRKMYGEERELFEDIDNMLEDITNDLFEEMLQEKSLEGLKKKAEKSGIPYSILKKVYDRGMAAWRTGHRPGASQEQWAYARVNSFITKGKGTWGKADADLAAKVRKEEVEVDEDSAFSSNFTKRLASKLQMKMGSKTFEKMVNQYKVLVKRPEYKGKPNMAADAVARQYRNVSTRTLISYINNLVNKGQLPQNLAASYDMAERFTQSDVDGLEKFADRILKKYNIDVEFTRHFVDRLNDPRNKPEIKVAELQRFFKKIQKNKGKDIQQNPDVEVVLKDLASDINLPVVINYKNGEFEIVNKTIMRKKDFKTPDKVIRYEAKSWRSEGHYLENGEEWDGDQHAYEGDIYTGKEHGPDSKRLYHFKELPVSIRAKIQSKLGEACWTGYKQVGMKKKGDKMVPDCVPEASSPAQQAAIAIAKKKSGKYDEDGKRIKEQVDLDEKRGANLIKKLIYTKGGELRGTAAAKAEKEEDKVRSLRKKFKEVSAAERIAKAREQQAKLQTQIQNVKNEDVAIQLERDKDQYVLHMKEVKIGKKGKVRTVPKGRVELRGKKDYEGNGYDPKDKLHKFLDAVGKGVNMSDLMNGNVAVLADNNPRAQKGLAMAKKLMGESTVPKDDLNFVATGGAFGKKRRFPGYVIKKENNRYKAYDEQDKMNLVAGSPTLKGLANVLKPSIERRIGGSWKFEEETEHDKCGTPDCCGQCDTATQNLDEAFTAMISDTMFANEFQELHVKAGFALHPSVDEANVNLMLNKSKYKKAAELVRDMAKKDPSHSLAYWAAEVIRANSLKLDARTLAKLAEEYGAGEEGTDELVKKYKKDTPGQ